MLRRPLGCRLTRRSLALLLASGALVTLVPPSATTAATSTKTAATSASTTATSAKTTATSARKAATSGYVVCGSGLGGALYQAGWSQRHQALWVTSTTHRPGPGRLPAESTILKVDPATRTVLDTIEPRTLDAGTADERPEAGYGLAVDDERDRLWTSATYESAVVVYDQSTGERVATIGGLGHARDIVIDARHDRAYVSDPINGVISVVSTRTLAVIDELIEPSTDFSPMSLELVSGPHRSRLFTVNLDDGALLEFDLTDDRSRVVARTGGERASGVAVDPRRQRAYVASQASQDLRTIDLRTGRLIAVAEASGSALNTDVDTRRGLVYTALFTGSAVLVTDARTGKHLQEIPLAQAPHDVLVTRGAAWVVDQSPGGSSLWSVRAR